MLSGVDEMILAAVTEVFDSMVMLQLRPGQATSCRYEKMPSGVSGLLGLAGEMKAILVIHCPSPVACRIASSLLGEEVEHIDADVEDAVGEIVNLVAGGMKDRLLEAGKKVSLAVPTTVRGRGVLVSGLSGAVCLLMPFDVDGGGRFWVEFKYRLPSPAAEDQTSAEAARKQG